MVSFDFDRMEILQQKMNASREQLQTSADAVRDSTIALQGYGFEGLAAEEFVANASNWQVGARRLIEAYETALDDLSVARTKARELKTSCENIAEALGEGLVWGNEWAGTLLAVDPEATLISSKIQNVRFFDTYGSANWHTSDSERLLADMLARAEMVSGGGAIVNALAGAQGAMLQMNAKLDALDEAVNVVVEKTGEFESAGSEKLLQYDSLDELVRSIVIGASDEAFALLISSGYKARSQDFFIAGNDVAGRADLAMQSRAYKLIKKVTPIAWAMVAIESVDVAVSDFRSGDIDQTALRRTSDAVVEGTFAFAIGGASVLAGMKVGAMVGTSGGPLGIIGGVVLGAIAGCLVGVAGTVISNLAHEPGDDGRSYMDDLKQVTAENLGIK